MIKLENVTKFYNSKGIITHALKNINLELYKNEFVAICGPSGSGKSTLLNVICKQDTLMREKFIIRVMKRPILMWMIWMTLEKIR